MSNDVTFICRLYAVIADRKALDGDDVGSARFGKASYIVSLTGMMLGILMWGAILWVVIYNISIRSCDYPCGTLCWYYRYAELSSHRCDARYSFSCYSDGYCYHN